MNRLFQKALATALFALAACLALNQPVASGAPMETKPWPADSVVYCLFPRIFSPKGDFNGVTAQLKRLKKLGVTVVWLMPIVQPGKAIEGHPTVDSPYCIHDHYALNPAFGTEADFRKLVLTAHKLGLKVILDEVLNHTSWDNPLIKQHPEYYVHSDGDLKNPATIQQAFTWNDVAQLNYADPGLRTYMIGMMKFWLTRYGVDGFRYDAASNPDGPKRMIPADFWRELGRQLRAVKPDVLLLGEAETPDLAMKPFTLDYGWWLRDDLVKAFQTGGDASKVQAAWRNQTDSFPAGMKHLLLQDNWDTPRDIATFGGAEGALAAAAFHFTMTGVPLIYNGMEIGNAAGGVNPHDPINWTSGDPRFPEFYRQAIALRRHNPALTQGAVTWLTNTAPSQVLTYMRTDGKTEFLVEINVSPTTAGGSVPIPDGNAWTRVPLAGTPNGVVTQDPKQFSLAPKEFAIFQRRVNR